MTVKQATTLLTSWNLTPADVLELNRRSIRTKLDTMVDSSSHKIWPNFNYSEPVKQFYLMLTTAPRVKPLQPQLNHLIGTLTECRLSDRTTLRASDNVPCFTRPYCRYMYNPYHHYQSHIGFSWLLITLLIPALKIHQPIFLAK